MFYAARGESVTVTDAVTRDNDGNPTTASGPRPVDGVLVQQESTSMNTTEKGDVAVTNLRALFPEDDPIAQLAKVQFPRRGTFHVVGKPLLCRSDLTGRVWGLIVDMVQIGSS